MNNLQLISPKHLILATDNARKSNADKAQDEELKANIAENGLLQNLVVGSQDSNGQYPVYAGGRRLRLVNQLIEEGALDLDIELPCRIVSDESQAQEASLAENTLRAPMHELDELEAYGRLIDDAGYTPERVAQHFGKPLKEVKKTLALAGVAEEIREACRKGEVDVDDLRSFAVTADKERQLQVFHSLKKGGRLNWWDIKNQMSSAGTDSKSALAKFVGIAAYQKAGGRLEEDLFNETTTLVDQAILEKLQAEKFAKAMDKLGDDWQFRAIDPEFQEHQLRHGSYKQKKGHTKNAPQELVDKIAELKKGKQDEDSIKGLRKLKQKLERYRDYSDDEKAESGCILAMNGASVKIYKGVYKPSAKKSESGKANQGEQTPAEKFPISLKGDLLDAKHSVAKQALAGSANLGADLLCFTVIAEFLTSSGFYGGPLDLSLGNTSSASNRMIPVHGDGSDPEDEDIHEGLLTGWFDSHEPLESFKRYQLLEESARTDLLAAAAGYSLSGEAWGGSEGYQDMVLERTGTNIAEHWRPTAENFFGRIKKDLCLQYGAEIFDDHTWPDVNKSKSRKQLAEMLGDKVASMDAKDCWLPPFNESEAIGEE